MCLAINFEQEARRYQKMLEKIYNIIIEFRSVKSD